MDPVFKAALKACAVIEVDGNGFKPSCKTSCSERKDLVLKTAGRIALILDMGDAGELDPGLIRFDGGRGKRQHCKTHHRCQDARKQSVLKHKCLHK